LNYEQRRTEQTGISRVWIGKPSNLSRGRGIKIATLEELTEYVEERDQQDERMHQEKLNQEKLLEEKRRQEVQENPSALQQEIPPDATQVPDKPSEPRKPYLLVVQEYIQNPMLVNGYKFDMRLYVVLQSLSPMKIFLYCDGLVRFCTKPYSYDDFSDRLRHLTNASIQNTPSKISELEQRDFQEAISSLVTPIGEGDFSKRDLRTFLGYLKHQCGYNIDEIWTKIQNVIILTLLTVYSSDRVSRATNCFELLGFDILLTDNLEAKLVEVNLGPSLSITSEVDVYVKKPLCEDMLTLVDSLVMKTSDSSFESTQNGYSAYEKREHLLAGINEPNSYVDPHRIGDFEMIFPFNQEVEMLSLMLCRNTSEPKDEIVAKIIECVQKRTEKFEKKYSDISSVDSSCSSAKVSVSRE
jgi:hypothetical protein